MLLREVVVRCVWSMCVVYGGRWEMEVVWVDRWVERALECIGVGVRGWFVGLV